MRQDEYCIRSAGIVSRGGEGAPQYGYPFHPTGPGQGGSSIPGERVRRQRGGVTREILGYCIGGGSVVKRDGIHGGQSMPLIPGGLKGASRVSDYRVCDSSALT